MTKKMNNPEHENKSGGAVCVLKVSAMTLPPHNELTLWCPGLDNRNHIVKIYHDGHGNITVEPMCANVKVIE